MTVPVALENTNGPARAAEVVVEKPTHAAATANDDDGLRIGNGRRKTQRPYAFKRFAVELPEDFFKKYRRDGGAFCGGFTSNAPALVFVVRTHRTGARHTLVGK